MRRHGPCSYPFMFPHPRRSVIVMRPFDALRSSVDKPKSYDGSDDATSSVCHVIRDTPIEESCTVPRQVPRGLATYLLASVSTSDRGGVCRWSYTSKAIQSSIRHNGGLVVEQDDVVLVADRIAGTAEPKTLRAYVTERTPQY